MNPFDTDIETTFVFNSYDVIADDFDKTRLFSWPGISLFLRNLSQNSIVLDAGCGNGRNMKLNDKLVMEGFDTCEKFVSMCKEKQLNVFKADIRTIPKANNYYDHSICVAVLGHIYNYSDRIVALNELLRVTKPAGLIFIQFWDISAVQCNKTPDKFIRCVDKNDGLSQNHHDYIVTWGNSKIKRYYHLFDMDEVRILLTGLNCSIVNIYQEKAGIIAILRK